jgi:very-short-patch-repair endonuclease
MDSTQHNSFPLRGKVDAKRTEGVMPQDTTYQALAVSPPQSLRDSSPLKGEPLKLLAKTLRKNATEHERWLWTELRGLKRYGARFRRQVVLGPYIVDFACHRSKIVIELDGIQHAQTDHKLKDEKRDTWLTHEGFLVLRYWNTELHENLQSVMDGIYDAVCLRVKT